MRCIFEAWYKSDGCLAKAWVEFKTVTSTATIEEIGVSLVGFMALSCRCQNVKESKEKKVEAFRERTKAMSRLNPCQNKTYTAVKENVWFKTAHRKACSPRKRGDIGVFSSGY